MSTSTGTSSMAAQCIRALDRWLTATDHHWYSIPEHPELGCYGTGYNSWGVQTNQKFIGAVASLGALGAQYGIDEERCATATARALAALRFSLASHVTGDFHCLDGGQWGETWISGLGLERMMYALPFLEPHLTNEDQQRLRRMLDAESAAILHGSERFGRPCGVVGDPWGRTGLNVPESNLWNGAICWRTAMMYPDHPETDALKEMAIRLLINSVSIPDDETNPQLVDGRAISEWFTGANFFSNYALDHHCYMNVGYMVICVSNAAFLHFDMKHAGYALPDALYHHQEELWQVIRKMLFADGRLCRIGGDTRVRYAYCQEYLLPSLALAADVFNDAHAGELAKQQMAWLEREHHAGNDPHFYLPRLDTLSGNPYYFTRLESDRACCVAMLAHYLDQTPTLFEQTGTPTDDYENSVAGGWAEHEHGDVLHRSPTRIASFSWRANGLGQGICTPPNDGHKCEWLHNLGGMVRFAGENSRTPAGSRKLLADHISTFDGGFVTTGTIIEGAKVSVSEGWSAEDLATTQLAICALPDGHSLLGLHFCRNNDRRAAVESVKSMNLNVPNDLFNDYRRELTTESGCLSLNREEVTVDEDVLLASRWANVDAVLGVAGIYGAESLTLSREVKRSAGRYESLFVEQLNWHCQTKVQMFAPGQIIADNGWAVLASANAAVTQRFAQNAQAWQCQAHPQVRGVEVIGLDNKPYLFLANFGSETVTIDGTSHELPPARATLLTGSDRIKIV